MNNGTMNLAMFVTRKKKKPFFAVTKVDLWHKKGVVGVLHQLLLLHSVPALDEVPKRVSLK
jgi:hypothetical protein